jgi:cobalamin biosynthesis Mg chelatase CobN
LVSLAVPPPPPPPPPATELGPASQTQAQSQAQAQGAAAQQEQEEPQFAYVTAFEAEEDIQFAMSVYEPRRRDLPASAVLGVGAVAVSMMFGLGYSLRRRVQVQRARH